MSAVFVFGCCALPFHHVIHKAMPFCHVAMNMMGGEHGGHPQPMPAREKQEPVKRIATSIPRALQLPFAGRAGLRLTASATSSYRSFITLGASRCDRDVGLHLLIATFLI
jgi:hypothetical protein